MTDDPPLTQLVRDLADGTIDSTTLAAERLQRVADRDGELRAFVELDHRAVLRDAMACDDARRQGRSLGPLHGLPIAIKDLFDVAGQVTTNGSLLPPDPPASSDAAAVGRIRAAGAVLMGRTRTHEFAWGLTTQHATLGGTRNPYDLTRVTGGSSGGSAAAIAGGLVPAALGTDTAGSLRLPAAWCGVVSHKPSSGLVPADGVTPLAPSLDHVGPLATDVAGCRLLLEVLSGVAFAPLDPGPVRVGVLAFGVDVPRADWVDVSVRRAIGAVAPASVETCSLPGLENAPGTFVATQAGEALGWHRATGRWPAHAAEYGPDVRSRLELAETFGSDDAARAARDREALRAATRTLFAQVDVVVAPVAGALPSFTDDPDTVSTSPGHDLPLRSAVLPYTVWANLCGLPVTTVPVGRVGGLPVGVQIIGAHGTDGRVLRIAERVGDALRAEEEIDVHDQT